MSHELQALLVASRCYRSQVKPASILWRSEPLNPLPALIIVFLPACPQMAGEVLERVPSLAPGAKVLPVIDPPAFEVHVNHGVLPEGDVLLLPLRKAEVLIRVGRALTNGQGNGDFRPTGALELSQLVGQDPTMLALKRKIELVAGGEDTVLLTGETGTGKELCARGVHALSPRRKGPFLPVNCGAIPLELFESELFGHRKGAFTGASGSQPGLIRQARGGTLFLDEVETLALSAQAKLLRFLQDRTYHAVGSSAPEQADVRIIASTNEDLAQMGQAGTFRRDLFYRLAVMTLPLPPLRERSSDIPLLVEHFWRCHGSNPGHSMRRISPHAWQAFCRYHWPGNVRELENVIRQLLVVTEADVIEVGDLPFAFNNGHDSLPSFKHAKAQAIEAFEREYLTQLLRQCHGNISMAARTAQKERRAFSRLLKKYQITYP